MPTLNKDGTERKTVTHKMGIPVFDVAEAANNLYDLLPSEAGSGLDIYEISEQLPDLEPVGCAYHRKLGTPTVSCRYCLSSKKARASDVIRFLRLELGQSENPNSINLIIERDVEDRRRQLYRLSADPGVEGEAWLETRRKTVFSRIPVDIAVWRSVQETCNKKTKMGREQYRAAELVIAGLELARLQFATADDFE